MRKIALIAAVSVLGALLAPEVAAAALARMSTLHLTYAIGESAQPVRRQARLFCQPTGGSHPNARAACAALTAVRGEVAALPPSDGACAMLYAPVTVTMKGR